MLEYKPPNATSASTLPPLVSDIPNHQYNDFTLGVLYSSIFFCVSFLTLFEGSRFNDQKFSRQSGRQLPVGGVISEISHSHFCCCCRTFFRAQIAHLLYSAKMRLYNYYGDLDLFLYECIDKVGGIGMKSALVVGSETPW